LHGGIRAKRGQANFSAAHAGQKDMLRDAFVFPGAFPLAAPFRRWIGIHWITGAI
jgi:hypothetical protein